ncbi:MAG: DNA polymerase, partial [Caldisericaceae bacterium]
LEFKTLLKSLGLNDPPSVAIPLENKTQEKTVGIVFDFYGNNLRGFGLATDESKVEYSIGEELFRNENSVSILRNILSDASVRKEIYNARELHLVEELFGIKAQNIHIDVSLGAYLIDPEKTDYSFEVLSHMFGVEALGDDLASKAKLVYELAGLVQETLIKEKLFEIYSKLEFPLSTVIFSMEKHGIKIDLAYFEQLSKEIDIRISELEKQIYNLAGISFNISSSKQLSAILFDSLGLRPQKMGKFNFSTSIAVLEDLVEEHPIVSLVLEYRHLTKLKSTYIEALPHLVSQTDFRLHTHFQHLGTSTGRLRSTDPNLQNIPIRGTWGEKVRKGFVSSDEVHFLMSADYSQIELRVLAHLSQDKRLVEAFANDEDIHVYTAMEIFKVKQSEVTGELRSKAKTVNFGIIYGISPYGLSKQIGCSNEEAATIINNYFERYSGVRDYFQSVVSKALNEGEVRTILGRRRTIRGLDSKNSSVRDNARRLAINSPIQGSAADLIKIAMLKVDSRLSPTDAFLILQIHDELIVETTQKYINEAKEILKNEMENAYSLSVPLKVNIAWGHDLLEAKA